MKLLKSLFTLGKVADRKAGEALEDAMGPEFYEQNIKDLEISIAKSKDRRDDVNVQMVNCENKIEELQKNLAKDKDRLKKANELGKNDLVQELLQRYKETQSLLEIEQTTYASLKESFDIAQDTIKQNDADLRKYRNELTSVKAMAASNKVLEGLEKSNEDIAKGKDARESLERFKNKQKDALTRHKVRKANRADSSATLDSRVDAELGLNTDEDLLASILKD